MRGLSILYVGQLWDGSTCLARARALERHGFEVTGFDVTPYYTAAPRLVRAFENRTLMGPSVDRLNRDVVAALNTRAAFDVLWVDKGTWIYPETLEAARRAGVGMLVHYTPDPAFHVHHSRHFRACVPLYDLCVTTKRYELELYRAAGARRVLFTWQGVDERFERLPACADVARPERQGIVFIGHHEAYYERMLEALASAELPLRVYGPRWPRAAGRNRRLAPHVRGDAVVGDGYVATLASGRIGLGLLCKKYPDAFTTRTFEIPASGAMLLAEDTEEHRELFRAGEEADFFASVEELIDKARYYLANSALREQIARHGREKVLRYFRWESVLQPVVDALGKKTTILT